MSQITFLHANATNRLKRAIKNKEFILYYQPKYKIDTEKYCGAEVLIRWQDPERGLVFPDNFIPLAEETGLILELGKWVIEEACKQVQKWYLQGLDVKKLSINVCAHQLKMQDLSGLFAEILSITSFDPQLIEIELTESAYIENTETVSKNLNELHDMGINIALDDFGTGYASLEYLNDFPINTVKLDRSFTSCLPDNKKTMAIVESVHDLATRLNLSLVVEGIETCEQLNCLKALKCDQGQGYLWSKPVPANEFEKKFLNATFNMFLVTNKHTHHYGQRF